MGIIDGRKIKDTFLKMNISTWVTLLVAVITLATPGGATEARVVCYYTNWSVYRPGTARFNPQNINPYLCTHLIYAFGGFTKDNTLKPFDKYQDIEKGGYAKFTGLKTYNKELKTMLAIGGWNEGSTRFSPMVASRERRKEFVRNAIKFLRQNKFDGLDLDWEYPAFRDGGKPKDRENYAKLVKKLREEFEKESEKTGRPRLLLTMAVPAGIEYIQKGFDVKTLNQYLDWMNLLTYDYHSAFEPAVNHHAPLYPLEEPNEYSVDGELNIDYTIKFYIESGADRDKLVLGIPTYGRSYTLFNADAVEIGSPADGPGEQGDATREKGYLAYYEICEALKPKEKKPTTPSSDEDSDEEDEAEDEPWTVLQPNPNAMGPVAYKGNQWVGYDDVDIVRKKAEYVADNKLGGIMFWSIDNDDFRGNCHNKPYPLIEAAKEAYIVGLGSTNNAVVTDRPKATTSRASSRRKTNPRTTQRPATDRTTRKSALLSTTPSWNANTPEPPTTPDPGSDFKCKDEGFFPHPRDCKKYFWCLDSGPSNLGIVAHQFTCPSGLFFNKAADSCDFARNVLCKTPSATTKAPTTKASTTKAPVTTTTTRRPIKLSTKSSVLFRTTTTTTTTPEPEVEEEYEEDTPEYPADIEAQDPKVLKELIDLIKKVGGVEQLEKQLHLDTPSASIAPGAATTTQPSFNKQLYKKVLERTKKAKLPTIEGTAQNSRRGPQNAGLEATADKDRLLKKDRPQYTSIRRARPSTTANPLEEEIEDESDEVQQIQKARAVEVEAKVGTTAKPLQYVNIRRARPTSDTADDTASRNALFERPESFVSVTESPNALDVSSARREHMPEYVTIRRQRPTTEEATTVQYSPETEDEEEDTALEKEISSQQPQYISIVRSRPSTTLPPEEVSSPEPTTVLAVQISSLLNEPEDDAETTVADVKEVDTTTSTTTTTTTTTTKAPSSNPPRRVVQRRRGSTTTTTSTAAPATQTPKRPNFLRRTKATTATTASDVTETDVITTTESPGKFTRRPIVKSRKEFGQTETAKSAGTAENRRRPSLTGAGARNERPARNFVRRRLGGANATTTTATPSTTTTTTTTSSTTRRPYRVASRRRPVVVIASTTTKAPTTAEPLSEETLQEIEDVDVIEVPATTPEQPSALKSTKIQRRPLLLKDVDQNPSATNEDERKRQSKVPSTSEEDKKRQSKKYSASFKQNQLDEVLRQKAKSQEEEELDVTTETRATTIDDYNAESALAIAAHQLLTAPLPIVNNFDEPKPTKKSILTTPKTSASSTQKPAVTTVYRSQEPSTAYSASNYESSRTTVNSVSSTIYPSTFTSKVSKPSGFTTPSILGSLGPSTATYLKPAADAFAKPTINAELTDYSRGRTTYSNSLDSTSRPLLQGLSQGLASSTAKFLGTNEKLIPVPVEDYSFANGGYSGGQEPSYFTREYLLESPVTKTYDDEYQYLSPATTPTISTRKLPKKTIYRKISTTIAPTEPPYVPVVTSQAPRRAPKRPQNVPFEKVKKVTKYRPQNNYDYYDDGDEKFVQKYSEGTKVVLHAKGVIECLDIGNFPHPASCKKFISCAKLENGSILGWEYICPKGLSFDAVGGICNWSAGLGCDEKDM